MMQPTLIELSGRLAAGFTIGAKGVGRGAELRRGRRAGLSACGETFCDRPRTALVSPT